MVLLSAAACSTLALTEPVPAASKASTAGPFENLQARLTEDGFPSERLRKLYSDPRTRFDTQGVSLYFVHSESALDYGQFTRPGPIERALQYMKDHRTSLNKAAATYGASPAVITAIALVETRLGTYVGHRSVFNTFSTMAALADETARKRLWDEISGDTRLSPGAFNRKAESKSSWAYRELKAFLKYTESENFDPLGIDGSYAGAMGICQFLPSNILTLAADGNGDGRIDVFDHADAIMSIANYLHNYGWRPGISDRKAYDVIYHYNHSSYYVNTILEVAKLLKRHSS